MQDNLKILKLTKKNPGRIPTVEYQVFSPQDEIPTESELPKYADEWAYNVNSLGSDTGTFSFNWEWVDIIPEEYLISEVANLTFKIDNLTRQRNHLEDIFQKFYNS